jgi:2-methylcitrate dehydratase PrpD
MTATVTDDLCDFAANLTLTDLPAEVRAALADTTGNALCLMVGAARHPAVETAVSVLNALSGPDSVPLLGRTDRLPGMWAALTHGIAGHVADFDDTHPATVVHPGPPVVAAALSAAARVDASGTELLTAVAAGVEVALRVGLGIVPEALDLGWHMTGVAGPVGAAVAAGRLLGLRPDRLRNAVGLAATQSAGLLEALGTMAGSLQAGKAAANGFEAAVLAHNGLDGPAAPIEGRRGLFALHAGRVDRPVTDGLGTNWELAAEDGTVRRKAHALTEPVLGERAAAFVSHAFDPGKGTVADLFAAGSPT